MSSTPLDLLRSLIEILDNAGITWALGGSFASTFYAEPRSTADVDIALSLSDDHRELLLRELEARFYVPRDAALEAIEHSGSFNVIDLSSGFKADLFLCGSNMLDRNQLARRRRVAFPGLDVGVWITAPEDVVLRKLSWWRATGTTSDRQWRDLCEVLRISGTSMDLDYLIRTAKEVGLSVDLSAALAEVGLGS
jgi:hypothetical protein